MAKAQQPAKPAAKMPGTKPTAPRHRVLYVQRGTEFQPVGSYELGDQGGEQQGEYLFAAIRTDLVNKARAAAAPIPFFLEQTEQDGLKLED